MSKIDDLDLDYLMNVVSPDAKISVKKTVPNREKTGKVQAVPIPSTSKEASTITTPPIQDTQAPLTNIKKEKRRKTTTNNVHKQSLQKQNSFSILLKDQENQASTGEAFTSVRVLKHKVLLLLLLFPEERRIDIIDRLITKCLVENKSRLGETVFD